MPSETHRRISRLSSSADPLHPEAPEEERAAAKIQAIRRGNIERNAGMPLLLRALQEGNETLVCKVIKSGIEEDAYNARDEVGCTPLVLAAQHGRLLALSALLDVSADINLPQVRLHDQALEKSANALGGRSVATMLAMRRLRAKGNLDVGEGATPDGATPVWVATKTGQAAALELLIAARADVNVRAKDGRSPVFIGTKNGHAECLKLLIAAGADVSVGSKKGKTPLIIAVTNDQPAALDLLITAGADLHKVVDGATALSTARQRSLHSLSARLCIAACERPRSTEELRATGEPAVLLTSLPAAFVTDPLDCVRLVADLVHGYRDEAMDVMAVNTHAGEQLLAQLRNTQQMLVAMLTTVDPSELEQSLLSDRGVAALLECVRSECKGVLSYAGVQRALNAHWRVVPPKGVGEGVAIFAISFCRLLWAAVYPPFSKQLMQARQGAMERATQAVLMRNIEPVRPAEDIMVRFMVDAVKMGSSFSGRNHDDTWEHTMRSWRAERARVASAEASMALRWFPLVQPQGKFALATACNLVLAILLVLLPAADGGQSPRLALLLAWTAQNTVQHVIHWSNKPALWGADPLNQLELAAGICGSWGLGLRLWVDVAYLQSGGGSEAAPHDRLLGPAQALLAAALVLLWTSQGGRILQRSTKFGPLIIMAIKMLADTARFLVMLGGPVVGFAAGIVTLFKGAQGRVFDECVVFDEDEAGGGIARSIVALLEILLGSDNPLPCLYQSSHPVLAPLIMDTFLVLGILLALNMLIAIMAKTFDGVYESMAINYMFLTAMMVIKWSEAPAVPPPLAMLGAPYYALKLLTLHGPSFLVRTLMDLVQRHFPKAHGNLSRTSTWTRLDRLSAPAHLPEATTEMPVVPGREQLALAISEYMEAHADEDQGESDRWRTRFTKRQTQIIGMVQASKADRNEIAKQQRERLQILEEQQRLLSTSHAKTAKQVDDALRILQGRPGRFEADAAAPGRKKSFFPQAMARRKSTAASMRRSNYAPMGPAALAAATAQSQPMSMATMSSLVDDAVRPLQEQQAALQKSFSEAFAEHHAAMAALQKQVTAQQKELVTALETIRAAVEYDDDDGHPKTVA